MRIDLVALLPVLLPRAIAWAEALSRSVLEKGAALEAAELSLARTVGVRSPEQIRLGVVDRIPIPDDGQLRLAALQAGLLASDTLGLTLGYAVLVRRGHEARARSLRAPRHRPSVPMAGAAAMYAPLPVHAE